ncbi:MAG: heavy metal translocating P-type ATPase metal-binding domain-containing protein [Melioribacteraceae bacterium]|nr:heavy metal translocating P-type ATPase metal-binding domain-containing protein [Melioribacteraceae bacterium]
MLEIKEKKLAEDLVCYHCGDICKDNSIAINEKVFCCNGCKTVYELLDANDLCNYYNIDDKPGITKNYSAVRNYDFLDDQELKSKLIDFTDGKITTITFYIPQMHCSSCIWLLENLYKLNPGVVQSQVNFLQKKLSVKYKDELISIKELVQLLDALGYEPNLNLNQESETKLKSENKNLYLRLGVAGFAFGNIMLLSFPEYLSTSDPENLKGIFAYLNMILSLPVLLYSSREYFDSAYKGLKKKIVNIDVPISLGIIVLFLRSFIEVVLDLGPGYFDSLAGLVFFLLIGKTFQNKTYEALNFERNYKSYFPIAITVRREGKETTIPVSKLEIGERIIIRNSEIIPADSILIKGEANIDYSFVTGESTLTKVNNGEVIYAGGRHIGSIIEAEIIKEVSQSYLTQLWNNSVFTKQNESKTTTLANAVSKYFTFVILAIGFVAFLYWLPISVATGLNALTAVLIVACPCALALSTPFTLGNTLRIFGRNKFYIKNVTVIETLAKLTDIVFDKTGTITDSAKKDVSFTGNDLNDYEKSLVKSCVKSSTHPLSRSIYEYFDTMIEEFTLESFEEIPGKGIKSLIEGNEIKIGSSNFVKDYDEESSDSTAVYISINNKVLGSFQIKNVYRSGLKEVVESLSSKYKFSVISGDKSSEEANLKKIFGTNAPIYFNQSPQEKLDYINALQKENKTVLMVGDGLNDAGALKQSDAGISISENINNFSPACDGILEADSFTKLKDFINFSAVSKNIIIVSFIISFLYNVVGIYFAVTGNLSPLFAAILMPLSSITVVVFTTAATNLFAKSKRLI